MTDSTLAFIADDVGAEATEYMPASVVYLIAFGIGDPGAGGHCWTFSRSFDNDWGVYTVPEIQQATIYGGIKSVRLHRSGFECVFEPKAAEETGYRQLRITFTVGLKKVSGLFLSRRRVGSLLKWADQGVQTKRAKFITL